MAIKYGTCVRSEINKAKPQEYINGLCKRTMINIVYSVTYYLELRNAISI